MKIFTNNHGNLELEFFSPINIDNGYTNEYQGDFTSTMELFFYDGTPSAIEWVVNDGEFVEHIGLFFENKKLEDYDGVFELPKEAIKLIRKAGYVVPKHFE